MTRNRAFLLAALALTLFLAAVVSFYASDSPDGLEKVAGDKGINAEEAEHPLRDGPLADYVTRGVDDERLSGALAGVAGVGLTLAAGAGLVLLVRGRGRGRGRGVAAGQGGQADQADSGDAGDARRRRPVS